MFTEYYTIRKLPQNRRDYFLFDHIQNLTKNTSNRFICQCPLSHQISLHGMTHYVAYLRILFAAFFSLSIIHVEFQYTEGQFKTPIIEAYAEIPYNSFCLLSADLLFLD